MRHVVRLAILTYAVLFGYDMWDSTMSPYWAGSDAWNLIGAGFFWLAVAALLAYVIRLLKMGVHRWRGSADASPARLK